MGAAGGGSGGGGGGGGCGTWVSSVRCRRNCRVGASQARPGHSAGRHSLTSPGRRSARAAHSSARLPVIAAPAPAGRRRPFAVSYDLYSSRVNRKTVRPCVRHCPRRRRRARYSLRTHKSAISCHFRPRMRFLRRRRAPGRRRRRRRSAGRRRHCPRPAVARPASRPVLIKTVSSPAYNYR